MLFFPSGVWEGGLAWSTEGELSVWYDETPSGLTNYMLTPPPVVLSLVGATDETFAYSRFLLADPKTYGCHTNVTMCGDEAKCIQTPSSVYCTCRSGFQKVPGKNFCQGMRPIVSIG